MQKLHELPTWAEDGVVRVVVESPRGSTVKMKYDPELGVFTMSRPLVLGAAYPFEWGFVPSTCAPDGDPLDAMALLEGATSPGVVLACKPIGVVKVTQKSKDKKKRERNDRIIAVPDGSRHFDGVHDLHDVPKRTLEEIEQFFVTAVLFEDKGVELQGWAGASRARRLIAESARAFAKSA